MFKSMAIEKHCVYLFNASVCVDCILILKLKAGQDELVRSKTDTLSFW